MAVTIREMRAEDVDAAVRLIEQAGVTVDRARVSHHLSLVACSEAAKPAAGEAKDAEADEAKGKGEADMPGVALCVRGDGGDVTLEVVFGDAAGDAGLVNELVGKALGKVKAAAIRSCRVHIHGSLDTESDPLSTGNSWFDRFMQHHAA